MTIPCPSREKNLEHCTCTYSACPRLGLCCQCVGYHRAKGEIPGCFFSVTGEASYDRSFANLCKPGNR